MSKNIVDIPERIVPYIVPSELSQPVLVTKGPFRLVGPKEGVLDADLIFRWLPSTAVEFEGVFPRGHLDLEAQWSLVAEGDEPFCAPVYITHASLGQEASRVSGLLQEPINLGDSSFEVLRFSLANFPDYLGAPVRYEIEGAHGLIAGRLHLPAPQGVCQLDVIRETAELRKYASQGAGFVVSHVGQWLPLNGEMSVQDAEEVLKMLHVWFSFLRGAWAGPLFPQGLRGSNVVWQQFAAWKLRETRHVTTWLPERRPLNLASAFSGFVKLWSDPDWRDPLKLAISLFVEANGSQASPETKIILAQVALDLLAWVHLVETQRLYKRKKFDKLHAAGRIRKLLDHTGVSATIPSYLAQLATLCGGSASDGPDVITEVRNKLVHATDNSRAAIKALSSEQLFECSQLALQYVELVLLAILGHDGHYARRGWRGWKGDDEVLVPWCQVD